METNSKPKEETSFKEKRIREITLAYYSRSDVRKAIFEFSKNRECIPRYFEGFGKRPDAFQYDSDILEQVKKGATSFHCSEEIWSDPLEISTELNKEQFDELRIGWDLLLDVDSPYLEYSKIYAELLTKALESHGVKNIGVKFSGSKGWHIIIPWKAFPKELYNQETKNMFPEWPRIICQYLSEIIQPKLSDKILQDESLSQIAKKTGKLQEDLLVQECIYCHRQASKKFLINWECEYCKNQIQNFEGTFNSRKKPKCPECRKSLIEKSREEILFCNFCNFNSKKNPEMFEKKQRFATEKLIDADLVLVAPRHLFRMPYSLHEKTSLASIVVDKHKIINFQIKEAQPFKMTIKNFYPECKEEEAKTLLLSALDWKEQKDKEDKLIKETKKEYQPKFDETKPKTDFKQIVLTNIKDEIFPPCIKSILNGVKQDGRKRALFILLNFFKSLGMPDDEIEARIEEWNKKNYNPLKQGYITSQLIWYKKTGKKMPPNCDKSLYKELNVCKPDELCRKIKNPVNYSYKIYFRKYK